MTLDERKLQVLSAIIDDYVETAVPVGSRTITRSSDGPMMESKASAWCVKNSRIL